MANPRLDVVRGARPQTLALDRPVFKIGRDAASDLRLEPLSVSRDHAQIVVADDGWRLRDNGSTCGTFVNGQRVTECRLVHGDRVWMGDSGGAEIVFLDQERREHTTSTLVSLRSIATVLDSLHALGAGAVLDDVLTLVLDAALETSGAERGFVMLADERDELELKISRGWEAPPLAGLGTSRRIPRRVFDTGEPCYEELANRGANAGDTMALGIRVVYCLPLYSARCVDGAEPRPLPKRIGVLYLDSISEGRSIRVTPTTRSLLGTLAAEAAIAIENARLYRASLEKARVDHELRVAAEIQRSLLPPSSFTCSHVEVAASSVPCRAIGGDFYDYGVRTDGGLTLTIGDVSGKGPGAALLSALVMGVLAAHRGGPGGPADTMTRLNDILLSRAVEGRFVTAFHAILWPDGRLTYCNAGHNPPVLASASGLQRLEEGGPVLGLLEGVAFAEATLRLSPGAALLLFSDGMSEARNAAEEEFGDVRIENIVTGYRDAEPAVLLETIRAALDGFTGGTPRIDDETALVLRYLASREGQQAPGPAF